MPLLWGGWFLEFGVICLKTGDGGRATARPIMMGKIPFDFVLSGYFLTPSSFTRGADSLDAKCIAIDP